MAISRNYLYDLNDQQASYFAKALSHPARLRILQKLSHDGTCTVEVLRIMHPISQPSISQHLRILRKAHLVDFKEKFPYTFYSLNAKNFYEMKGQLKSFLDKF